MSHSRSSRPWLPITTKFKVDSYDIRKYRSADIADELTLINRNLLLRIKPEELFDFAFLSIEKDTFAPNVTMMLEFYDRIVALFSTQIVRQKSIKERVSVIVHLFLVWKTKLSAEIVRQLYVKNHDIHSMRIVLTAFDHSSVYRLRETWHAFRITQPKFYTALKFLWNVLSQDNNWEDYQLWLEQKFIKDRLAKNQSMLLFVGYLLSKMVIDRYRYFQTQQDTLIIANEKHQTENESSSPGGEARVHTRILKLAKSPPTHLLLKTES